MFHYSRRGSVFVKMCVFEHLKLISLCEQTEKCPDVRYLQLLIYLFCNGKTKQKIKQVLVFTATGYLETVENISLTSNSVQQETKLAASQFGADR